MNQPPTGQEVVVMIDNNSECLAIWDGDQWVIGVNNNPVEEPLELTVVDWRWRDS